jgi:bifunctional pyridoxal-dependent enzyme with beta-cystathionase and maltose regulon repressor activities
LEALVLLALCFGIYKIYNQGWPIYLAYGIAFLDSMVYTLAGAKGNNWRIGITKKAVVLADREVKVVYFTGLRKIEKAQDTLYFNYIKDLQMDMPIVAAENQKEFLEQLMQHIDHNKVYVDQSVKKILQNID